MEILSQSPNGCVAQCRSDDGLVTALVTPTTTLYGNFTLVDQDGRQMWRGEYLGPDGKVTGERVSKPIWASAVKLMDDWTAHQTAIEDDWRERALQRDIARHNSLAEKIAQAMDDPNSDL